MFILYFLIHRIKINVQMKFDFKNVICLFWIFLIDSGGRGRGGGARRGRTRSGRDTLEDDVVSSSNSIEGLDELKPDPDLVNLEPKDEAMPDEKSEKKTPGPKSRTWFPGTRIPQYDI